MKLLLANFHKDMLAILNTLKITTLLDAGCGEGFTTVLLSNKYEIKAIDTEKFYINYARMFNKRNNISYEVCDIFDINYKKQFDLVLCNEVLEHIEDYDKAIKLLKSASKKYLLISVPNEPYFQIANFLRLRHLKTFGNLPDHKNRWTTKKIREIMAKYGKIETTKTSSFWNFVLISF